MPGFMPWWSRSFLRYNAFFTYLKILPIIHSFLMAIFPINMEAGISTMFTQKNLLHLTIPTYIVRVCGIIGLWTQFLKPNSLSPHSKYSRWQITSKVIKIKVSCVTECLLSQWVTLTSLLCNCYCHSTFYAGHYAKQWDNDTHCQRRIFRV